MRANRSSSRDFAPQYPERLFATPMAIGDFNGDGIADRNNDDLLDSVATSLKSDDTRSGTAAALNC